MVTRQANEPAVAANVPTFKAATEPPANAIMLADQFGAAIKQFLSHRTAAATPQTAQSADRLTSQIAESADRRMPQTAEGADRLSATREHAIEQSLSHRTATATATLQTAQSADRRMSQTAKGADQLSVTIAPDFWDEMKRVHTAPMLTMHGALVTAASSAGRVEDPEFEQAIEEMNLWDLPSATLMLLKPDGVTWDEFAQYAIGLDADQLDYVIEHGDDGEYAVSEWANATEEAFSVAIVLGSARICDCTVDDVLAVVPDDTDPINFARALVCVGEDTRASLLSWGC